jgi:hypothetical protein
MGQRSLEQQRYSNIQMLHRVRRGRDRVEVGFTTINAISAYHH